MLRIGRIMILLFCSFHSLIGQNEINISSKGLQLYGTLNAVETDTVLLIISGSGQTDRNGNTLYLNYENNCLKMLAEEVANEGLASLRYDKRGVGKSVSADLRSEDLRFDHYVEDAIAWIKYLKEKYTHVIVLGHSQGALVGMKAIQNIDVYKFISLAGLSENLYSTLRKQLANQPKYVTDAAFPILDSLNLGKNVEDIPDFLQSLFNPRIQAYFMSFLEEDPKRAIANLNVPILLIIGNTDLQISVDSVRELAKHNQNSSLIEINEMNHVLKNSSSDVPINMQTYQNPSLKLHKNLVPAIVHFIRT